MENVKQGNLISIFSRSIEVRSPLKIFLELGYLKDSNAAVHSVTAPAWNIWAINCDIFIIKLVIHFLAVSPPVVELLNEEKSSLLKLVE